MYVFLLDDGHEIHVPYSHLEHFLFTPEKINCEQTSKLPSTEEASFQCYPSLLASDDAIDNSIDASAIRQMSHLPLRMHHPYDLTSLDSSSNDMLPSASSLLFLPIEMELGPF